MDTLEVNFTPVPNSGNITSYVILYTPSVNTGCSEIHTGGTSSVSVSGDTTTTVEIDGLEASKEYCVAVAARSAAGTGNYSYVLLVNGEYMRIY